MGQWMYLVSCIFSGLSERVVLRVQKLNRETLLLCVTTVKRHPYFLHPCTGYDLSSLCFSCGMFAIRLCVANDVWFLQIFVPLPFVPRVTLESTRPTYGPKTGMARRRNQYIHTRHCPYLHMEDAPTTSSQICAQNNGVAGVTVRFVRNVDLTTCMEPWHHEGAL